MRTRIAPTPSGYLHVGNLVNFQLTARLAALAGWELGLRIDDADQARVRAEYVADIFDWLTRLEIGWRFGPSNAHDLATTWSQSLHTNRYWAGLLELAAAGAELFVCGCSRSEIADGTCKRNCRGSIEEWQVNRNLIRLRPPAGLGFGEPVMWRRDGVPAYHLTNVLDDIALGISHVVRGADLAEASRLHAWLNDLLGVRIRYLHHPLLLDQAGHKISKSQGTDKLLPSAQLLADIEQAVRQMLPTMTAQLDA